MQSSDFSGALFPIKSMYVYKKANIFSFKIETDEDNTSFSMQIVLGQADTQVLVTKTAEDGTAYKTMESCITINWGDGNIEYKRDFNDNTPSHVYEKAGEYTITTVCTMPYIQYSDGIKAYMTEVLTPFPRLKTDLEYGSQMSFSDCVKLKKVCTGVYRNIFDRLYVSGRTFENCVMLEEIPLDVFAGNESELRTAQAMFKNCPKIKSVPDGYFDKYVNVTNYTECFSGDTGLESVPNDIFYNADITGYLSFNDTFRGCISLAEIPEQMFNTNAQSAALYNCFNGCVNMAGSAPHWWEIYGQSGGMCFAGCTSLENYEDIPLRAGHESEDGPKYGNWKG